MPSFGLARIRWTPCVLYASPSAGRARYGLVSAPLRTELHRLCPGVEVHTTRQLGIAASSRQGRPRAMRVQCGTRGPLPRRACHAALLERNIIIARLGAACQDVVLIGRCRGFVGLMELVWAQPRAGHLRPIRCAPWSWWRLAWQPHVGAIG